jgi:hypothetical protein
LSPIIQYEAHGFTGWRGGSPQGENPPKTTCNHRKISLEDASWSLFLNFLKISIYSFQKYKKILDVKSKVLYSSAKSQHEIVYIPAYIKVYFHYSN